jgi:hypothetical protein
MLHRCTASTIDSPTRAFLTRALIIACVVVISGGATALCVVPTLSSAFYFPKNYSEGWNAYHALSAVSGEMLYSGDPRRLVNYPFLSFYLIGWLKPLFGNVLMIGRTINLMALAATAIGSALLVRRLGGGWLAATFGAACVLGFQAIQAPDWIAADDPQMLAQMFMTGGLLVYLGDRTSLRRLACTAALLGLGGFTKHNLVAIPATISFDIWYNNRRLFWLWCGFAAAALLTLTGLTYAVAGGDFLHELLAPRLLSPDPIYHTQKFAIAFKIPVLLSVIFLMRTLSPHQAMLLRCWGAVSLAAAIVFSSADGASFNIFLDVAVFLGVAAGLALQRARQWLDDAGPAWRAAMILLPLALAQPIVTRLPRTLVTLTQLPTSLAELSRLEDGFTVAAAVLRSHPGDALCEDLLPCFEAGKKLLVDPYNAREMILTGRLDEASLLEDIRRHRFALIVMPTRIYSDPYTHQFASTMATPARFTENTLHAIESNYEPFSTNSPLTFYAPRTR